MANIATYLQKILEAVYGEEVRGSIHDALEAMNVESNSAMTYAKDAKDSAFNSAAAAKKSETTASEKAKAASTSAEEAKKSETNASSSAASASTSAQASESSAQRSENAARDSAKNAVDEAKKLLDEYVSSAASSKSDAETAAANARSSETAAETAVEKSKEDLNAYVQAAVTAKNGAESAAASASSAALASSGFATSSENSATAAAGSAETAKKYSGNPPKVQDGTWWIWNADSGEYVDTGWTSKIPGPTGVGIKNIDLTEGDHSPGTYDTYTIMMTDENQYTFKIYNGKNGIGSGDMEAKVYDPTGKKTDIFKYIQDLIDGLNKKYMELEVYDPTNQHRDVFAYIDEKIQSVDKKLEDIQDFYDSLGENRSIFHNLMDSAGDSILDNTEAPVKTRFVVVIV